MTRRPLRTIIAALLAVVLFSSTAALACGPFMLEAVFVYTVHPAYPLERFAAGRVGVLQPTYARSYLYVAYRHLAGSPFTSAEQQALTQLWKERLDFGSSTDGDEDLPKAWFEARKKVAGDEPTISVYRSREKPNEWESYLNCQKDAFENAATTLNDRIAKYGAENQAVRTWVAAQDEVFSNCGGGNSIPAELPAEADALAHADRAYQIAAANFYSTNFEEAQKRFEAIAADAKSPWQRNATYLVARALARKGSLGPPEQKEESLEQAQAQLRKILADQKFSSLHAASTRLLNLVRLRLHPRERVRELAQVLTNKTPNPNLKQDLTDYTILLDGLLERDEDETQATTPNEENLGVPKEEDLSDWIATFQGHDDKAGDHALARWQATHTDPWLIAALTHTEGKDPKANELIAEALKVKNTSAAFVSARFHAIRLLIEQGKNSEARKLLDQSLNTDRSLFDESSLNLLTSKRMLLAQSLPEFLADAARVPAALSWNDDGREIPAEQSWIGDTPKARMGAPSFDYDAGHALNEQLPLSVLKEAVKSNALAVLPRRDLAQAAWLRAALLGDTKTADELSPILAELLPDLKPLLNTYQSSIQPDEKKFAAIYAWLKFPGLEPVVDVGYGREAPLSQQDSYRDNWWCRSVFVPSSPEESREVLYFTAVTGPPPAFLSPAEVQKGASEAAALRALGTAPNYIARQVIEYANRRPADPRLPEALHLAVRTTRYGCTDKETVRWSKAAFDVLHKKYPSSPWAKKTPYWFKD